MCAIILFTTDFWLLSSFIERDAFPSQRGLRSNPRFSYIDPMGLGKSFIFLNFGFFLFRIELTPILTGLSEVA